MEKEESSTFLATTPGQQKIQGPDLEEANDGKTWKRTKGRLERQDEVDTKEMDALKGLVLDLQQQVNDLKNNQNQNRPTEAVKPILESCLLKEARKRLRFDIKDVHTSIMLWENFFKMHGIVSDSERFFAVEQLLPVHLQRALAANDKVESSFNWLVKFLKSKYDPKYLCYELAARNVGKQTNINELEDLAIEAADCPKEHLIKHFMLQPCSQFIQQKMKPFLLLPMKEFKFRLKMVLQEDSARYGGTSGYSNKVNALSEDSANIRGSTDQRLEGNGNA